MGLRLVEQFGDDDTIMRLAFKPWFKAPDFGNEEGGNTPPQVVTEQPSDGAFSASPVQEGASPQGPIPMPPPPSASVNGGTTASSGSPRNYGATETGM
uniref:Serine/threonine protein kinase n=1 Tax=Ascaris lumbricoides TaxID=6252 RepID=A0A0M3HF42_ASCLU